VPRHTEIPEAFHAGHHRVAIYLRVSTLDQTTANQEREFREVASQMGCGLVKLYRDHGISGANGRAERPQLRVGSS
jgi:DNA invertase Pin-like site-specific DNA recombinase